jgi:hypothetical protein
MAVPESDHATPSGFFSHRTLLIVLLAGGALLSVVLGIWGFAAKRRESRLRKAAATESQPVEEPVSDSSSGIPVLSPLGEPALASSELPGQGFQAEPGEESDNSPEEESPVSLGTPSALGGAPLMPNVNLFAPSYLQTSGSSAPSGERPDSSPSVEEELPPISLPEQAPELELPDPGSPGRDPSVVSFEDLGISFPSESEPSPELPSQAGPTVPPPGGFSTVFEDDRIVIKPPATPVSSSGQPTPEVHESGGMPDVPAAPSKPGQVSIDLDDLLFGVASSLEAPSTPEPQKGVRADSPDATETVFEEDKGTAQARSAAPAPEGFSLPIDFAEESLFVSSGSEPAPAKAKGPSPEDTFHEQDTVMLAPSSHPDDQLDATKTIAPVAREQSDPALDVTKAPGADAAQAEKPGAAPPEPGKQAAADESFYVASPTPGVSGGQLDERSERMFREQYERGMRAMTDKNWKQAVHFLSIAAAIHPDSTEVRGKLREARDAKRKNQVET